MRELLFTQLSLKTFPRHYQTQGACFYSSALSGRAPNYNGRYFGNAMRIELITEPTWLMTTCVLSASFKNPMPLSALSVSQRLLGHSHRMWQIHNPRPPWGGGKA